MIRDTVTGRNRGSCDRQIAPRLVVMIVKVVLMCVFRMVYANPELVGSSAEHADAQVGILGLLYCLHAYYLHWVAPFIDRVENVAQMVVNLLQEPGQNPNYNYM